MTKKLESFTLIENALKEIDRFISNLPEIHAIEMLGSPNWSGSIDGVDSDDGMRYQQDSFYNPVERLFDSIDDCDEAAITANEQEVMQEQSKYVGDYFSDDEYSKIYLAENLLVNARKTVSSIDESHSRDEILAALRSIQCDCRRKSRRLLRLKLV